MRLARLGAAVGAALVIPGLAGAGDPRLLFEIRPPVTAVLENGGRRDALLTIDAYNPGDRRVRVERMRLTYFEGDAVVGTVDPATSIFTRAGLLSDPRIDPGGIDRWEGLCLAPPTAATDRARFDFDARRAPGLPPCAREADARRDAARARRSTGHLAPVRRNVAGDPRAHLRHQPPARPARR